MKFARSWKLIIVGLLAAANVQAYILPTDMLMRMLVDKRRKLNLKDLTISATVETQGETYDERIYLKNPERLRRVSEGDDGTVYVVREGKSAAGKENGLNRIPGPATDLLPALLAPRGKETDDAVVNLIATLKSVGIATATVSLGRVQNNPCYIIGAKPWESTQPQLWLDKATYLPVRTVVKDESGNFVETRYSEFESSITGHWFPRVTETYQNGSLVRRSEVSKVDQNQNLPETLFHVP